MVGRTIHELFGETICSRFNYPSRFASWGKAPDHSYIFKGKLNRVMHRFTLHGLQNIEEVMRLLKEEEPFIYEREYRELIKTIIASHSYLDLFNFYVVPSYPKSIDFKYIKEQSSYYFKSYISHFFPKKYQQSRPSRKDWIDCFKEILESFKELEDFYEQMFTEFYDLPQEKGFMTKRILELYD